MHSPPQRPQAVGYRARDWVGAETWSRKIIHFRYGCIRNGVRPQARIDGGKARFLGPTAPLLCPKAVRWTRPYTMPRLRRAGPQPVHDGQDRAGRSRDYGDAITVDYGNSLPNAPNRDALQFILARPSHLKNTRPDSASAVTIGATFTQVNRVTSDRLSQAVPTSGSIVARNALDALVALLRLQGHGRDRAGFEPGQRDRVAGHFAIAIFAFVQAADRAIDLGDQLALAVAGAKLDRPVGLARRAVGEVGLTQRVRPGAAPWSRATPR